MDRKVMKAIIAGVIILVANVGIFVLGSDFTTTFWIGYVYTMAAALLTVYVEIFFVAKEELIFRYPISTVTFVYLAVQIVSFIICTLLLWRFPLFTFILDLCILAAFIVMLMSVLLHNSTTKEQQAVRAKDIVNFKYILDTMNTVISKVTYADPNRKILIHAYDSLASGQARSDVSVMDLEQQILSYIDQLDKAVSENNAETIKANCDQIEYLAAERKRRLSQRVPF